DSAAIYDPEPELPAGHAGMIAQHPEQRCRGIDVHCLRLTVDQKLDLHRACLEKPDQRDDLRRHDRAEKVPCDESSHRRGEALSGVISCVSAVVPSNVIKRAKLAKVRPRRFSRRDAEIRKEKNLLPSYLRVSASLREYFSLLLLTLAGFARVTLSQRPRPRARSPAGPS